MMIQILRLEKIVCQLDEWLQGIEMIEEQQIRNIRNIRNKVLKLRGETVRLKEIYTKQQEEKERESKNEKK